MKGWQFSCPTTGAVLNISSPTLVSGICRSCGKPLVPDHLSKEALDKMKVDNVTFSLNGREWRDE